MSSKTAESREAIEAATLLVSHPSRLCCTTEGQEGRVRGAGPYSRPGGGLHRVAVEHWLMDTAEPHRSVFGVSLRIDLAHPYQRLA